MPAGRGPGADLPPVGPNPRSLGRNRGTLGTVKTLLTRLDELEADGTEEEKAAVPFLARRGLEAR